MTDRLCESADIAASGMYVRHDEGCDILARTANNCEVKVF